MSTEALEYGLAKNEQALKKMIECVERDEFKPFDLHENQVINLEDLR
jgi:hypothetical protein